MVVAGSMLVPEPTSEAVELATGQADALDRAESSPPSRIRLREGVRLVRAPERRLAAYSVEVPHGPVLDEEALLPLATVAFVAGADTFDLDLGNPAVEVRRAGSRVGRSPSQGS